MVREEGGVSGKVILSPSSKAQTLRFEKKKYPRPRFLNSCLKPNSTVFPGQQKNHFLCDTFINRTPIFYKQKTILP